MIAMEMKMNKFYLMFILLSLLVLTSCSNVVQQQSDLSYHTGTQGLEFEFHGLLQKLYEATDFQILVQLYNKGAYDIQEAYVVVTLEKDYMEFTHDSTALQSITKLQGKSILNPIGDFVLLKYNMKTREIDKTSQYHDSLVTITACYKYMTDIISEVCIDPHFYDLAPTNKACEVKDLSLGDQGAPVAISNVEVKMLPNGENFVRPQFIIHLQNRGNGHIINYKSEGGIKKICSEEQLDYNNWNLLQVSKVAFNNDQFIFDVNNKGTNTIECVPNPNEKLLRLQNEEAVIRCTVTGNGISKTEAAYITQLQIKLDYGYTVSQSEKIKIEKQLLY